MKLGFIGLGRMGRPMTEHLLKAGHEVAVHNRSRQVVDELTSIGANAGSTPGEVASQSDIVMTCLTNTESVESVYFGPDGLSPQRDLGNSSSTTRPWVSTRLPGASRLPVKRAPNFWMHRSVADRPARWARH